MFTRSFIRRFARVALVATTALLVFSSVADAAIFELRRLTSTGSGAPGFNSINANVGDQMMLGRFLTPEAAGVRLYDITLGYVSPAVPSKGHPDTLPPEVALGGGRSGDFEEQKPF